MQGLTPSEVVDGYEMALDKTLELLPSLVCHEVKDLRNEAQVAAGIKSAIASKQYGQEDFLTGLIAKACGKRLQCSIAEKGLLTDTSYLVKQLVLSVTASSRVNLECIIFWKKTRYSQNIQYY